MAGASDKARFYLEQVVPELRELERKKLFSKTEIASIARKRSDFEHVLNARGAQPADYAKYIGYEINLQSLCRKRARRLGLQSRSSTTRSHSSSAAAFNILNNGPRRIYGLLDRATKKFPGDVGLWMQYYGFARGHSKAGKKVDGVLTAMLRLHPTRPELWSLAAGYAFREKGDMGEARGFMLKGLRFCGVSEELWVEYGRLEMIYVAKLWARRRVLGIENHGSGEERGHMNLGSDHTEVAKVAVLNDLEEPIGLEQQQVSRLEGEISGGPKFEKILSGGIVTAVFDETMSTFYNEPKLAARFFNMVADVDVPSQPEILDHILEHIQSAGGYTPDTLFCQTKRPVLGMEPTSPEFPLALEKSLDCLETASERLESAQCRADFFRRSLDWTTSLLEVHGLDSDVLIVLRAVKSKLERRVQSNGP